MPLLPDPIETIRSVIEPYYMWHPFKSGYYNVWVEIEFVWYKLPNSCTSRFCVKREMADLRGTVDTDPDSTPCVEVRCNCHEARH